MAQLSLRRADQIKVGDVLDLEGDPYANTVNNEPNPHFQFEFVTVCEVENEGPSVRRPDVDCIRLGIEGVNSFGFPADHILKVYVYE